jgi:hypothetical protein
LQIEIYLTGNALMIKSILMGIGSRSDLYPTSANTFLLRDDTIITGTLVFLKDSSDNVNGFTVSIPGGGTVVAQKRPTL